MTGKQKRIALEQVEGWAKKSETTLKERLDIIESGSFKYEFIQKDPAILWAITHSLKFQYPDIKVIDDAGDIILANIQYLTENYLEISFIIPTSGKAYINK